MMTDLLVVAEEDGFLNESLGRKHGQTERSGNTRALLCWNDYTDGAAATLSTLLDFALLVNERE